MPFAIQFMVPLFAKTVSITSNWTKWIPNMALVIGENAIDIYKSSKWFGVPDCGSRITSGNTKCITSGNIQKSHTPHTLDPHFGQHGFHHFGQHVKHRSYHLITWLSHLGFGWGVGRDHSTYIITWLSHLGFGWGVGRDHSTCIITWLSHSCNHIFSWRYHHHDHDEDEDE